MKRVEKTKTGETVRVTSGVFGGRSLKAPGGKTHPMGSREKLALFNMLGDIHGLSVLDAFAGSGALGIEALSRGALRVVFVEKNAGACNIIKQNLAELDCEAEVICADAGSLELTDTFDVVIADPPYDAFDLTKVLPLVNYLEAGGVLVLSHPGEAPELDGLALEKSRQYAAAHLSFYQK